MLVRPSRPADWKRQKRLYRRLCCSPSSPSSWMSATRQKSSRMFFCSAASASNPASRAPAAASRACSAHAARGNSSDVQYPRNFVTRSVAPSAASVVIVTSARGTANEAVAETGPASPSTLSVCSIALAITNRVVRVSCVRRPFLPSASPWTTASGCSRKCAPIRGSSPETWLPTPPSINELTARATVPLSTVTDQSMAAT